MYGDGHMEFLGDEDEIFTVQLTEVFKTSSFMHSSEEEKDSESIRVKLLEKRWITILLLMLKMRLRLIH